MSGFLLRKAGAAVVVLFLASVLVFLGVRAIPGDPAIALGGESRDPAVLKAIRHEYLLDRSLPVQYAHWIWLAVHGNLGIYQDLKSTRLNSSHRTISYAVFYWRQNLRT